MYSYSFEDISLTLDIQSDSIYGISFGSTPDALPIGNAGEFGVIVQKALDAYFCGDSKSFDLPYIVQATEFQKCILQEMKAIGYGEVMSYSALAAKAGYPKAQRAVGMVCNKNPLPILIPCHRVIGKNGKLTGFAGGLEIKERLLKLEQRHRQ